MSNRVRERRITIGASSHVTRADAAFFAVPRERAVSLLAGPDHGIAGEDRVSVADRPRPDLVVTRCERHLAPAKHLPAAGAGGGQLHTVDLELHGGSVRVDLDLDRAGAHLVAAPRDVDHGLRGPVRLVVVEGVLLRLAVVADQALVVATPRVALVAAVHGEVEHVPDELAPQIGSG